MARSYGMNHTIVLLDHSDLLLGENSADTLAIQTATCPASHLRRVIQHSIDSAADGSLPQSLISATPAQNAPQSKVLVRTSGNANSRNAKIADSQVA
jgi:hypothetical protein